MPPSMACSRAVARQSKILLRRTNYRQASTAAETAAKAKDQASQSVSKASEGLSRVTTSASSAVSSAGSAATNALGKIGGRTGRLIKFVESLIPPTVYYGRVGLELGRLMVNGQKMAPPSISQFQSFFEPVTKAFQNPRALLSGSSPITSSLSNPQATLNQARNINGSQVAYYGIIGAEVLGFFTVGTMIGRMKVVGYHGEVHHEH